MKTNKITFLSWQIFIAQNLENCPLQRSARIYKSNHNTSQYIAQFLLVYVTTHHCECVSASQANEAYHEKTPDCYSHRWAQVR